MTVKNYIVTVAHDEGEVSIHTAASSSRQAEQMIMTAEGCPQCAIQTTVLKDDLENARQYWAKIAKDNGWYKEPFYVQVWVHDTAIVDSVSHKGLEGDIICKEDPDEMNPPLRYIKFKD